MRLLGMVVALAAMVAGRDQPIVLEPLVDGEVEAALLIVPGAFINGQYYEPLGRAIQAASPLKLWVGLVRPFAFDLPNGADLIPDLEATLAALHAQGMTTENIFLAGHSLGGTVLQDEEWSSTHGVLGWVLLASYLPAGTLANASRPVMHISGDLDGMVRVSHVLNTFIELENLNDEEKVNTLPVVLLEDVNHMHFASGEIPAAVETYDILSPMSQEVAQALIAPHIGAFLSVTLGSPVDYQEEARAILMAANSATRNMLTPLWLLRQYEEGDGIKSTWAEEGQRIMSSLDEEGLKHLLVDDTMYDTTSALGNSKPHVTLDGDYGYVTTCSHAYPHNILEANGPLTPRELAVKFKSREALQKVMAPLGLTFGDATSCMEVNEAAFNTALNMASDIVLDRFNSRGRPFTLLPDDVKSTGSGWLYGNLHYNVTDAGLTVSSPSLHTAVDVGLGLGGMHYCKLLAPSRALEYLMVDSLRGTTP